MADFRGYVTAAGQTFEALAKQMGYPVTIGFIEVGDGKLPDSESPISRTQLVHKLKQFPAIVEQDTKNPGQWVATCYIPADDAIDGAGYFIREIGCKLINQGNGVLYAYRRVSDDWKPVITSGEAKSFIYKLRFIPSNGELLTPTIDPSVVLVDKDELARTIMEHEGSRNHPDSSETEKGFSRHATKAEVVKKSTDHESKNAVVTAEKLWLWAEESGGPLEKALNKSLLAQIKFKAQRANSQWGQPGP
ncbi:phage tail protein, partial [Aeromonas caviae]